MLINFDEVLISIDGEELSDPGEGEKKLTIGLVCINVLMIIDPAEIKKVTGKEKVKRYALAIKINKGGEIECETDDIVVMKSLIGVMYGTAVVGPSWRLLEGQPQVEASTD